MSLLTIRSSRLWTARRLPALALLVLASLAACGRKKAEKLPLQTAAVTRRTIISEATASGQVEPMNVVEVKSKSAGQITEMTIETGSQIKKGDLLVQLDPRDVNQGLEQAKADLAAADAKLKNSQTMVNRNQKLFDQQIITAQELESSQLDFTNSNAQVIRAKASLDLAQQRVDEATVRAPIAGTVLTKPVSLGQVIASATNSASGGTILLTMADLSKVRVRALFNETDIGNVVPGQPATVTVDAFPDRPFRGIVEKREPTSVVQSSVTMFPVLVSLDNLEGLLMPGMNGEVSVLVDRRENVLAVPNDAVRTTRDAVSTAKLLGLDPDSVNAQVQEQVRALGMGGSNGAGNGGGARGNGVGDTGAAGRRPLVSKGEVDLAGQGGGQDTGRQGGGRQGGGRQGFQMPEVTDAQCQAVTAAFAKHPDAQAAIQGLRGRMQAGEFDQARMRVISDSIYKVVGVEANISRACQFRARGGGSGQPGTGGGQQAGGSRGASTSATAPSGNMDTGVSGGGGMRGGRGGRGGNRAAEYAIPAAGLPVQRQQRTRLALVYIATGGGSSGTAAAGEVITPRVVRAGMSDLDYTEVAAGIQEGDRVVLLAAVQMQAQRDSAQQRMRSMTGGGLPGAPAGGGQPGGGRGRGQ